MYDFITFSDTIFGFGCRIIFPNFEVHKNCIKCQLKKGML